MGDACMEIAYADHRDNRMIIVWHGRWPSVSDQEAAFSRAPATADSDFILDFHDDEGLITKDKYLSVETVEALTGVASKELIRRGRIREAALTRSVRAFSRKEPSHDR